MSVPTPRAEAFMPMVAPSPPELPPLVRAGLYGHRVVPRYEQVSRCMSDCGLVVSVVSFRRPGDNNVQRLAMTHTQ